ncbi:hypothetical protein D9M70_507270 [compost metagenome]
MESLPALQNNNYLVDISFSLLQQLTQRRSSCKSIRSPEFTIQAHQQRPDTEPIYAQSLAQQLRHCIAVAVTSLLLGKLAIVIRQARSELRPALQQRNSQLDGLRPILLTLANSPQFIQRFKRDGLIPLPDQLIQQLLCPAQQSAGDIVSRKLQM